MTKRITRFIALVLMLSLCLTAAASAETAEELNLKAHRTYEWIMEENGYKFYCCMDLNGDGIDELLASDRGGYGATVYTMDSIYTGAVKYKDFYSKYIYLSYDPSTGSLVASNGGTGFVSVCFLKLERNGDFTLTEYWRSNPAYDKNGNMILDRNGNPVSAYGKQLSSQTGTRSSSCSGAEFCRVYDKRDSYPNIYFHRYTGKIIDNEIFPAKAIADETLKIAECTTEGYTTAYTQEEAAELTDDQKQYNKRVYEERENCKITVTGTENHATYELLYIFNKGLGSCRAGFFSMDRQGELICSANASFPIPSDGASLEIISGTYDGGRCVAAKYSTDTVTQYKVFATLNGTLFAEFDGEPGTAELEAFESHLTAELTSRYGTMDEGSSMLFSWDKRTTKAAPKPDFEEMSNIYLNVFTAIEDYRDRLYRDVDASLAAANADVP